MQNNCPAISIITVCYNSAKTISQTIESILGQSYSNIEYIIVDGMSTDNTLAIIKDYVPKFAAKGIPYRFISEPDNGIYDAMNKGIVMAKGEWVNIQGSDDTLEKDACENIVNCISKTKGIDIVYGLTRQISNGQVVIVMQGTHWILGKGIINHQAAFIKRSIYDKFGLFSMQYKLSADLEYWLRIKDHVQFYFLEQIVNNYCLDGASSNSAAVFESLKIQYKYNIINLKTYFFKYLFNYLKKIYATFN